jgi:hypothetical protein
MSDREIAGRTGSGEGGLSDKAAPQSPQNRLAAEFWLPQLGHFSTRATPQSPQKFLSSRLGLPQLGHRTSMFVCVAFNSPFTSSPPQEAVNSDDKPRVLVAARATEANAREFSCC